MLLERVFARTETVTQSVLKISGSINISLCRIRDYSYQFAAQRGKYFFSIHRKTETIGVHRAICRGTSTKEMAAAKDYNDMCPVMQKFPALSMRRAAHGDFKVIKTDYPYFASYAILAVQKWRFQPAMKHGQPVPYTIRIPFDYRIP